MAPRTIQRTATKTPLFSQHMPGGPWGYADIMRHTGDVFFVQSTSATAVDDTGHGRTPEAPFATLAYAAAQCTANVGDVIYLMPGHVELITGTPDLTMTIAGVNVYGCGNGTIQPIIRFTTAIGAELNIDAADITFENVNFQAGFADLTAPIDVNALRLTIRKCKFTERVATENALIWLQLPADGTAAGLTLEDNYVYAPDTANTHWVNFSDTGAGHKVRRNVLLGDWGTMAIGGAGVIVGCDISDNWIYNLANTANGCINLAATATGTINNNRVGNSAAASSSIDADGCAMNENYGVDIGGGDVQGILEPASA